jgi:uncharacterized membrane protein
MEAQGGAQQLYTPPVAKAEYSSPAEDAEVNKVWGILAYIIFLIPMFVAPKNSKFARYHTNQGISLVIVWASLSIALSIVSGIASAVTGHSDVYLYGIGWGVVAIFGIIRIALTVSILALTITGISNAYKGEMKQLPIIGKINLLKV